MKPSSSPWPKGVSQPAQRALVAAGITNLEELSRHRKEDLAKLHGMGPKALGILEETLASQGLSFK